ncbi:hypothetical protein DYB26_002688 [Aphanomyces astaci]|uniref:WW domain-containing protein n=1 Tax=Aphanomyces astaci TaxID=112090 RepID=A0A3R6XFS2_APHAT|nr:hypothetical protein DYB26_002688 [Aphanomyces astaci]
MTLSMEVGHLLRCQLQDTYSSYEMEPTNSAEADAAATKGGTLQGDATKVAAGEDAGTNVFRRCSTPLDGTEGGSGHGGGTAASPWLPFIDDTTGATYYYNQETQEISWTDPAISSNQGTDSSGTNGRRPFPGASSRPTSATQPVVLPVISGDNNPIGLWPFSAIDSEITSTEDGGVSNVMAEVGVETTVELRLTSSEANVLLERKESRGVTSLLEADDDDDGEILLLHNQMMENNKSTMIALDQGADESHVEAIDNVIIHPQDDTDTGEKNPSSEMQSSRRPSTSDVRPLGSGHSIEPHQVLLNTSVDTNNGLSPRAVDASDRPPHPVDLHADGGCINIIGDKPTLTHEGADPTVDAPNDVIDAASREDNNFSMPIDAAEGTTYPSLTNNLPEVVLDLQPSMIEQFKKSPDSSNALATPTANIIDVAIATVQPMEEDTTSTNTLVPPVDTQTTMSDSPTQADPLSIAKDDKAAVQLPPVSPQIIPDTMAAPAGSTEAIPSTQVINSKSPTEQALKTAQDGSPSTSFPADICPATEFSSQPLHDLTATTWVEAYDDQRSRSYYYDPVTSAVSWDHPGGLLASPQQNAPIQPPANPPSTASTEPPRSSRRPSLLPPVDDGQDAHAQESDSTQNTPSRHNLDQKDDDPVNSTSTTPPHTISDLTATEPIVPLRDPNERLEPLPPPLETTKCAVEKASTSHLNETPTTEPPEPSASSTPTTQRQSRRQEAEAARAQAWASDVASWQRLFNQASNQYHTLVEQMQEAVAAREAAVAREVGSRDMRKRQFAALLSNNAAIAPLSPWDVMARNIVGVDLKRLLQDIIDDPAKYPSILQPSAKSKQQTPAEVQQQLLRVRNKDGDSLLHLAVWKGSVIKVKHLLSLGADVNLVDNSVTQWTPLHEAARSGHIPMTKLLLSAGASITATDAAGDTALHWACRGNHSTIVKVLLHADPTFATLHAANHKRKAPLDLAKKPTLRSFLQDILAMHHSKPTAPGLSTARSSSSSSMLKSGRSDKSVRPIYPSKRNHL